MDQVSLSMILSKEPLPFLISFVLATTLSIWPGYHFVLILHRLIRSRVQRSAGLPKDEDFIRTRSTLGASTVGCVERIAYIFGIMFAQAGIITGVIILKAFFAWTDWYDRSRKIDPGTETQQI